MSLTLGEIADLVDGKLVGNPEEKIEGIAGLGEAKSGDLTFLANTKYLPLLKDTKATAVILHEDLTKDLSCNVIYCENPSLAFVQVAERLRPPKQNFSPSIHPSAVIASKVEIGPQVHIGPLVVIEEGAQIGEGAVIAAGSFIGRNVKLGQDGLIYQNVSIREECQIGNRVIIHCGAVLGCDGYGFVTVKSKHHKIPQMGIVVIEDDVEIGANVTIDRARFERTIVRKGTKIDNLVQIAHNVELGQNCLIVAQVGISGSTKLGNSVTLAGQVGVAGHLEIGDQVVIGAQGGVTKSLPDPGFYWGTPARVMSDYKRQIAYSRRLPQLAERVKMLEKKLIELENKKGR